jgi:hypothetical protein
MESKSNNRRDFHMPIRIQSKQLIFSLFAVFLLAAMLAGCGTIQSVSTSTATDRLNANYTNALPVETQLVLGTLKLEGTPQAVDSAAAPKLVPLYSLLEQMTAGGTSAQAEIDAVLDQIQANMTPDQIRAIAAMKLTSADLQSYLGQNGGSAPATSGTPASPSSSGSGFPIDAGGGGVPPSGGGSTFDGGGPSGGAPSGGTGSGLSQNQIATLQAQETGTPGFSGSGTPAILVNQLIQLLQKKTQTATPTP